MQEIWKDIYFVDKGITFDYRDLYQVSNYGRIKSLPRLQSCYNGREYVSKERYLKNHKNSKGYLRVWLKKEGKGNRFFIHRLVAIMFIPNPENKPCVNHKNCVVTDNKVANLEWCTQKENMEYMTKLKRNARTKEWGETHKQATRKFCKKVIGTNIETGEIVKFDSMQDAQRNGFVACGICECCKGKRKYHYGYKWRYDD